LTRILFKIHTHYAPATRKLMRQKLAIVFAVVTTALTFSLSETGAASVMKFGVWLIADNTQQQF